MMTKEGLRNINIEGVDGGYIIRWWYWEDKELKSSICVRHNVGDVLDKIRALCETLEETEQRLGHD